MTLRKNILVVFIEKHSLLVLFFISSMILARLLTPTEIGLFSITLGIAALAHKLRDFGIGQYIVQEKELTDERVNSAFTITLIISWSLALVVYISSNALGTFYSEPRLIEIVQLMAMNFLMLPFGSIGVSLLRREMLFKQLYVIHTLPQIVQTVAAIGLAVLGFSYLSLVYACLLSTAFTVILSMLLYPAKYTRSLGVSEFRHVAGYSTSAMGSNLMVELGESGPDFILSRALGFDSAAIYSRANGVLNLFNLAVTESLRVVALSELSRRVRDDEAIREPFFKSMSYITVVAWPFFGFLFFEAEALISLLYGQQWLLAAPLLSVLALMATVSVIFSFGDSFIISMGLQRQNLHYQVVMALVSIVWLIIGSAYSLQIVAMGFVGIALLRNLWMYHLLKKPLGLSFQLIYSNLFSSFAVAMTSLLPVFLYKGLAFSWFENAIVEMFALATAVAVVWAVGLFASSHSLTEEIRVLSFSQ